MLGLAMTFLNNAHAQADVSKDLHLCAQQETPELKLACFEALAALHRPAAEVQQARPDVPAIEETKPAAAEAPPVYAVPAVPPSREADASPTGEIAAEPTATVDQRDAPSPAPPLENSTIRATVTEVRQGYRDVLYFHLANGDVWRQIEAGRFPYPKDNEFEVEITPGMLSESRLRVNGKGRMTRVRRVAKDDGE
jgi:hypothetical protein